MGSAHCLIEVNILPKFNENLSRGSGDKELTRKCFGQMKGIPIIPLPLRSRGLTMAGEYQCKK